MLQSFSRLARGAPRAFGRHQQTSVMPSMSVLGTRHFAAKKPTKGPRYDDMIANGSQALYLESMYAQWKAGNLNSPEWAQYFQAVEAGTPVKPPMSGKNLAAAAGAAQKATMGAGAGASPAAVGGGGGCAADDTLAISYMIQAYQQFGHLAADLDPLGLSLWRQGRGRPEVLSYQHYGFSEADLQRELQVNTTVSGGHSGFLQSFLQENQSMKLQDVVDSLERVYCGSMGIEFTHITDFEQQNWVRNWVESARFGKWSPDKRLKIYERVVEADSFERFLGKKFKTTKRFGVDGCETLIAGMKGLIDRAANFGCEDVIIGMPHRGRLNVLANVLRKPLPQVFAEFRDSHYDMEKILEQLESQDWSSAGDVKYHLGAHSTREYGGKQVTLTLEANPSHLETVGPVALGRARAKQFFRGDEKAQMAEVLPILIHGDAAFAGQGVCYESMQLAKVKDFSVGGSIHIIVNNQVGFTTNPWHSRSTEYCSDIGKTFNCPIFHVNGDDGFAVVEACEMAAEFRQKFQSDVVIDIVCFRRFGHNEIDNPDFTQPKMYEMVRAQESSEAKISKTMIALGHSQAEIDKIRSDIQAKYEKGLKDSETYQPSSDPQEDWTATSWKGFFPPLEIADQQILTGVPKDEVVQVGRSLVKHPEDPNFKCHKTIEKLLESRSQQIEDGKGIDWGHAEALGFGTLLKDGYHIRLTGQDVQRGTFSHRHCVVTNQNGWDQYCFLNNIQSAKIRRGNKSSSLAIDLWNEDEQGTFVSQNSILSEYGVLGFELGYSYESPFQLNIWEAQFGDFANTAQVMFDQYISTGEHKWFQQTGLVMLLPHGYDGQGSEHSSCRMERFLQMADDDEDDIPHTQLQQIQHANWQVYNITTPANYFHALRKQCLRKFRKPLVIMSPKNLLRHKNCVSDIDEFTGDTKFLRVISERNPAITPDNVTRLIFCTGKIYYELAAERERLGLNHIAIVSMEQLTPFPYDKVLEEMTKYKNVDHGDGVEPGSVVWVQEEPKNMGAWNYIKPRMVTTCRDGQGVESDTVVRYIGRRAAASPATGLAKLHMAEQAAIIESALGEFQTVDQKEVRRSPLLGH